MILNLNEVHDLVRHNMAQDMMKDPVTAQADMIRMHPEHFIKLWQWMEAQQYFEICEIFLDLYLESRCNLQVKEWHSIYLWMT